MHAHPRGLLLVTLIFCTSSCSSHLTSPSPPAYLLRLQGPEPEAGQPGASPRRIPPTGYQPYALHLIEAQVSCIAVRGIAKGLGQRDRQNGGIER